MKTDKQLLFDAGLNNEMLAQQLGIKSPYVAMYFTGNGNLPVNARNVLRDYFLELGERPTINKRGI